jgi:hypothetical protein
MTRTPLKLISVFAAVLAFGGAAFATNVTTYHNDNFRTGWNNDEGVLTPKHVRDGAGGEVRFRMQHFVGLDEQVDAQPLVMAGQHIAGHGSHSTVVYVATENNTVYAIDGDSGKILLQKNFGTPVPIDALPGGCNNNSDVVGIGGTPVIDAANGVMYVITYNYVSNVQKYFLHKISLETLNDVAPKVRITASATLANGHHYNFTPSVTRQRAALLLQSGTVYAGFASFCDVSADQSRGWVLGWNASTLAPLAANEMTNKLPTSPDSFFLSSIWMSGYGLAANSSGLYYVTGNSDYSGTTLDPVNNIAESAVRQPLDLSTVSSIFTPSNAVDLEHGDVDYGSGGFLLLPPQPGQQSNLGVAAGKDGNLYLLNADSMQMINSYGIGSCWCGQSYFTTASGGGRIVSSGGNAVGLWAVKAGVHPSLTNEYFTDSIVGDQAPGFFTSVSSLDSNSVVIWAVSHPDGGNNDAVSLYAFNAPDGALLFSGVAGYWPNTDGNANIVPVVADNHAFVASFEGLAIYGLTSAPAAVPTPPGNLQPKRISLTSGQHEFYGTVTAMNGWTVTVKRRDGSLVKVDTLAAVQAKNFAEPTVGHGVLVRGHFTGTNAMTADYVLHAKDHADMWRTDR